MSELVQDVIAGLRLAQPDLPLCEVHRHACQKARLLGELNRASGKSGTSVMLFYMCKAFLEERENWSVLCNLKYSFSLKDMECKGTSSLAQMHRLGVDMTNNDGGQHLPADQRWLFTSSVKHFFMLADLLRQKESDASTMSIVSGSSGTGKSTAALMYQSQREQERQITPPSCRIVRILPGITTSGLMNAIAPAGVHEDKKNSMRATFERFDQIVSTIDRDHIQFLIFDNGEYLKHQHLEVLRMLAEQTHCALLLMGFHGMLKSLPPCVIDHVGLRWTFSPLETEEVLQVVLPQLVFTGWVFDPHNDSDLAFGKELWETVRPSLRRLHTVLNYASLIAQDQGEQMITAKMIHQVFRLMGRSSQPPDEDDDDTNGEE